MLFRIEDISGFNPILRDYDCNKITPISLDKAEVDEKIAKMIRDEVNGSNNRILLSYSKSLATCLLKYNKFADNELHIYNDGYARNLIRYISSKGHDQTKSYLIQDRLNNNPLFKKNGKIGLLGFNIDISNNTLLNKYLCIYTGTGKKVFASPEKDKEVVVFNPENDYSIKEYMDSVYLLYALQLRYGFLNDLAILNELLNRLFKMEPFRFEYCPNERKAIVLIINYLATNWQYEKEISQQIYTYAKEEEHVSFCYDSILQFDGIMTSSFNEAYALSDYNDNVISELIWYCCKKYLTKYL